MLGKFKKEKTSVYDAPIAKVLESMETYSPEDSEFSVLMNHLNELTKMKSLSSEKSKVDANTMATVAGNLLGILTIVAYEQKHVWTSKATGFILKAK